MVKTTAPQLSVAVGAVQLTGIEHPDGSEAVIFVGQAARTGGTRSISVDSQQIAPPFLLWPAITVKSPKSDPTNTGVPQFVAKEAFTKPSILKFKKFDANFPSPIEPVTVKVPPEGTMKV